MHVITNLLEESPVHILWLNQIKNVSVVSLNKSTAVHGNYEIIPSILFPLKLDDFHK